MAPPLKIPHKETRGLTARLVIRQNINVLGEMTKWSRKGHYEIWQK
jgi:hypothetical protein